MQMMQSLYTWPTIAPRSVIDMDEHYDWTRNQLGYAIQDIKADIQRLDNEFADMAGLRSLANDVFRAALDGARVELPPWPGPEVQP